MTNLPEILDELFMVGGVYDHVSSSTKFAKGQTSEAQSRIYEAMPEMIGKTEKGGSYSMAVISRNELRSEQRAALKKWAYGNDKEDK